MVNQAARICSSVSIPVIADGDNGHGSAVNVVRTVREFERSGAAGLHLEDQTIPKRCGNMSGHVLVSVEEMCGKVKAALDARVRRDFMIIARTDAIPAFGIDAAIERGVRYKEAGADAIMVIAPGSRDDLVAYRNGVSGPLVVTMGSWSLAMTASELEEIGYQVVMYPLTSMRCAVKAVHDCLTYLFAHGHVDHGEDRMIPVQELNLLLDLPGFHAIDATYESDSTPANHSGVQA
jgi:2-methylisocitrate lyase-like PEP mutase family enzyme